MRDRGRGEREKEAVEGGKEGKKGEKRGGGEEGRDKGRVIGGDRGKDAEGEVGRRGDQEKACGGLFIESQREQIDPVKKVHWI
ncbi:hypothetical protein CGQ20_28295, partial [Klebsiella pneumoniae]